MPFWISTSCSRIAILAHRAQTDRFSGLGAATWFSVTVAIVFADENIGRSGIGKDIGLLHPRHRTLYLYVILMRYGGFKRAMT